MFRSSKSIMWEMNQNEDLTFNKGGKTSQTETLSVLQQ